MVVSSELYFNKLFPGVSDKKYLKKCLLDISLYAVLSRVIYVKIKKIKETILIKCHNVKHSPPEAPNKKR